ncbi:hypothetical protein HMPREF1981_03299 [Bacteroides pyogenes F0041]|uniref:DUF4834 family protein n=1 Tax=Bacteroides pyogenes F0041 TaxID=1321819 RepID=U2CB83_9BACE|nr:DUF4834 family protein [Bacteroides pyogenes]ERI81258.1 hypothetical protein HMPREF1981_03299 [Bacteroides pyogenes F0041]MBB3894989.1 hypothetical protein [Bacteroides pyogenes]SUV33333.1 Uncharacterised protein [Bacteroides pyogenes]
MSILLFLLFFLFIVLLFGLSIIITILRAILGFGRNSSRHKHTNFEQRNTHQDANKKAKSYSGYYDYEVNDFSDGEEKQNQKKIFSKDEGEYVDFEEIKDDSSS